MFAQQVSPDTAAIGERQADFDFIKGQQETIEWENFDKIDQEILDETSYLYEFKADYILIFQKLFWHQLPTFVL